jgi:hypothetical protein
MKKSIRKRLSRDQILGVLKAFRRSRQSQISFSESESIPLSTLQYWLRKEREGGLAPNRSSEPVAGASRLVPVRIMDEPMARAPQLTESRDPWGESIVTVTIGLDRLPRSCLPDNGDVSRFADQGNDRTLTERER